ncbi:hypothetical protein GCM10010129_83030 [Streptomyces fumigatiscleroticus]|nr:hypothetical protein GCM10010129_83030 [Streptomyces fumigatiscleroticus]
MKKLFIFMIFFLNLLRERNPFRRNQAEEIGNGEGRFVKREGKEQGEISGMLVGGGILRYGGQ